MHVNLNRATSRQILLADLEDVYHLGAHLDDYESDEDGATATFADGRKDRGDILVGADGDLPW
jgi:2-polyprenyl-6-methoxyphenol hydroxylase-like FAD-dependent oxidoreductase